MARPVNSFIDANRFLRYPHLILRGSETWEGQACYIISPLVGLTDWAENYYEPEVICMITLLWPYSFRLDFLSRR